MTQIIKHTHPYIFIVMVLLGLYAAHAASIGTPIYAIVPDASTTPTNYDLSVTGTQDWQLYDGSFTPPTEKQFGTSITLTAPVKVVLPCVTETLGSGTIRSHATFNWTGGTSTSVGTAYDPNDAGFKFSGSAATVGTGVNFEQYTFVPGDTNQHTIHLYGYAANYALLNLQFSNSLAGVASVTTNPPTVLGDFDYSVTFQADHTNDALTVTFTFSKTSTATTLATAGINAAAMSGTPPATPLNWRVIPDDTNFPTSDTVVAGVVFGDNNFGWSPPTNPATQDCSGYVLHLDMMIIQELSGRTSLWMKILWVLTTRIQDIIIASLTITSSRTMTGKVQKLCTDPMDCINGD